MSQTYNIALTRHESRMAMRRNQNTVKFRSAINLGPVSHTIIIAIMLAALGLIYLTQITKTSTFGYTINDLSQKQEQLISQKQDLEVETARLQALQRVEDSNVAKAMTPPTETAFANTN